MPSIKLSSSRVFLFLVTIGLTAATAAAGLLTDYVLDQQAQQSFDFETETITDNINQQIDYYRLLALNLEAYLAGNPEVSTAELNQYANLINLQVNYPGVANIAVLETVEQNQLDPMFLVTAYAPIGSEANLSLGDNPTTDDAKRIALERSIQADELQISNLTNITKTEGSLSTEGFSMFMPINTNPNRVMMINIRAVDFFRVLLLDVINRDSINVEIVDISKGETIFSTGFVPDESNSNNYTRDEIVSQANKDLLIKFIGRESKKTIESGTFLPLVITGSMGIASFAIISFLNRSLQSMKNSEKLAEASSSKAEQLENQLQTIIDNTSVIVFVKDKQGKYTLINNQLADVLGKPSSELIGKTDFDIYSSHQAATLLENDRKVINSGKEMQFEEKLIPDRNQSAVHFTQKFPLKNKEGEIYAVAGIATDITRQKQNTLKLEERKSELERINNIMVDRELKMVELKNHIKELEAKLHESDEEKN